ncbi:ABC transporter ATP-binding protein [Curtobacterium sp. MWU13-2055]|nr:ATP-binding cassette domain-containing protein [Curtobacterium sp. MWU13-2055]
MTAMIELIGIRQRFGSRDVLTGVDLELRRGEVLGLLGANGSGKSTLLRIVTGIDAPAAGQVSTEPGQRRSDLRVGALLDPGWLDVRLTCQQHLAIALINANGRAVRSDVRTRLVEVGLGDAARRRVKHLSLGMRQRLALALALVESPDALILDEPLNGLDPDGVLWMRNLIREFTSNGGAVLLSSHLMAEMERIATRVLLLAEGSVSELERDRTVLERTVRVHAVAGQRELCAALEEVSATVREDDGGMLTVDGLDAAQVFCLARDVGAVLTHLAVDVQSLEEQYRDAVTAVR